MANILKTLIVASEKAACVARACCSDSTREALFVTEKSEGEANPRFDKDFKTIADVLAQEAAKTEIAVHFPVLADKVRGEECSEIGGVNIAVQETVERTAELLTYLVPPLAAKRMAEAAHHKVDLKLDLPDDIPEIDPLELGIWIDPIDATSEFIAGATGRACAGGGLPCVTVLVGAFLRSTGVPVLGVINQPFYNQGEGRVVWGVCYKGARAHGGLGPAHQRADSVLLSSAEDPAIADQIRGLGFEVATAPGAGYKLLQVALGEASAYVVTAGSTFRWDTCGPHAVLKALGGDVIDRTTRAPLTYVDPERGDEASCERETDREQCSTKRYCNSGGIVAFAHDSVYTRLESILK